VCPPPPASKITLANTGHFQISKIRFALAYLKKQADELADNLTEPDI
jgi:hypothetical protein